MADRVIVQVEGIKEAMAKLRRIGVDADRELARALYLEGERIMMVSKHLVPVDTGVLRSSGHVTQPKNEGRMWVVLIGYGGPAVPYAIVQHENTKYSHTVGQAKYLEVPAVQAAADMPDRIRKRLRARFEKFRSRSKK